MAISEAHAGRSYPPTAPYPVSEAKIAEFATAIGETNAAYFGPEAIAPPTFVASVSALAWEEMFADPELGLALRRIVHGDQRFTYQRPVRVGDALTATLTLERVRNRGAVDILTTSADISDADGELVCTAVGTLFHSHPAEQTADATADETGDQTGIQTGEGEPA